MFDGCGKCMGITAWLFIVAGVVFLLKDLGIWNFWNIEGWTVLFLIIGVTAFGSNSCSACRDMRGHKKK